MSPLRVLLKCLLLLSFAFAAVSGVNVFVSEAISAEHNSAVVWAMNVGFDYVFYIDKRDPELIKDIAKKIKNIDLLVVEVPAAKEFNDFTYGDITAKTYAIYTCGLKVEKAEEKGLKNPEKWHLFYPQSAVTKIYNTVNGYVLGESLDYPQFDTARTKQSVLFKDKDTISDLDIIKTVYEHQTELFSKDIIFSAKALLLSNTNSIDIDKDNAVLLLNGFEKMETENIKFDYNKFSANNWKTMKGYLKDVRFKDSSSVEDKGSREKIVKIATTVLNPSSDTYKLLFPELAPYIRSDLIRPLTLLHKPFTFTSTKELNLKTDVSEFNFKTKTKYQTKCYVISRKTLLINHSIKVKLYPLKPPKDQNVQLLQDNKNF